MLRRRSRPRNRTAAERRRDGEAIDRTPRAESLLPLQAGWRRERPPPAIGAGTACRRSGAVPGEASVLLSHREEAEESRRRGLDHPPALTGRQGQVQCLSTKWIERP